MSLNRSIITILDYNLFMLSIEFTYLIKLYTALISIFIYKYIVEKHHEKKFEEK